MSKALKLFDKATAHWFTKHLGSPTPVQEEGWPAINSGENVLISAPTGSGKTLSAFLVFIDRLMKMAAKGDLEKKVYVIYISPLKALGNDIRENLRRPLDGIGGDKIDVAIRTGDTTQSERRRMIKSSPHILITTPESLYLLLTSISGQKILESAQAVIIDELHALISSKRGAHLMLSLARLDVLCGKKLQRIALSATIEPLNLAAEYISCSSPVTIVNPKMFKSIDIEVNSPLPDMRILPEGTIWTELARMVHEYSINVRTVIVFVESRAQAEKLSYYVNKIGGDKFSKTHHGCVSKEQRLEAEQELRSGKLKVLCATSSMELGIDVGEVDMVLQIGFPRTISGAMQRLGRAGHSPERTSVMHMFPRMASETLYCGLTAKLAIEGGIENSKPPRKCLDVLAQHLVSMATGNGYTVDDVMMMLEQTYCFKDVSREELEAVLRMLAGDYEHQLDHPVRPRILYDRIHGVITGDAYSRMLALSTGGTIPDKGLYTVRLADGTKIGELDEEFVFEARVGDKFMLGSFAWRISEMTKDNVLVSPASPEGAQSPFWKGEQNGRSYQTGIAFGKMLNSLTKANADDRLFDELRSLKLDYPAANNALRFLSDQFKATDCLPDNKTIIIEHFKDPSGESQIVIHSVFGRKVNSGLALLTQEVASKETGMDISCFEDDDGFLIYPYGGSKTLPEGLLYKIDPKKASSILTAILPATPLFNMAFRYNAARALMMGVRKGRRQPLWIQRLKSAEFLDGAIIQKDHPLIAETKRECLEDYWDMPAIEEVLSGIHSGKITVKEMYLENPSPMSLAYRRQVESVLTYDYHPTTSNVFDTVQKDLEAAQLMKPQQEYLDNVSERKKMPKNEQELHSLLMTEGDLVAGELNVPLEWLISLSQQYRTSYIEPGLWICSEQLPEYSSALEERDVTVMQRVVRRVLRYRGAQNAESISERYVWEIEQSQEILDSLVQLNAAVLNDNGQYYHADLYNRAQQKTITMRRKQAKTLPPERYEALLCSKLSISDEPQKQLKQALENLLNHKYLPAIWESVILPARVQGYQPGMLDNLLAQGEFFWQFDNVDRTLIGFHRYEDIDWENDPEILEFGLTEDEKVIIQSLMQRGASFANSLPALSDGRSRYDVLLTLSEKGIAHADSFIPVRHWLDMEKIKKAPPKQKARAKSMVMSAGRWELTRPLKSKSIEDELEQIFNSSILLCRETAQNINWSKALEILRIWEYTGKVRRGYFIKGLSGAQYIRDFDYYPVISSMEEPDNSIIWLNAADPAQVWGKALPHVTGKSFKNINSTAIALRAGYPALLLEKNGNILKVFDDSALQQGLTILVDNYRKRKIFPQQKRLTVKQYPPEADKALVTAGFSRQMNDYVVWQYP